MLDVTPWVTLNQSQGGKGPVPECAMWTRAGEGEGAMGMVGQVPEVHVAVPFCVPSLLSELPSGWTHATSLSSAGEVPKAR